MKATEVQAGDRYHDPASGIPIYIVLEIIDVVPSHVKVLIEYQAGGTGIRTWDPNDDVPLDRPKRKE